MGPPEARRLPFGFPYHPPTIGDHSAEILPKWVKPGPGRPSHWDCLHHSDPLLDGSSKGYPNRTLISGGPHYENTEEESHLKVAPLHCFNWTPQNPSILRNGVSVGGKDRRKWGPAVKYSSICLPIL